MPGHDLLAGKVVVVTAAAGAGIGAAVVRRALEEGAKAVVFSDTHERRLAEAEEALAAEFGADRVRQLVCDVTDEAQVQALLDAADEFGGVDVMINNAGLGGTASVLDMTDEQWCKVLDITLDRHVPVRARRRPADGARPGKKGVIVNNASVIGWRAQEGQAHYAAAKAGVMALTRCAAIDLAPHGIRVNAVSPSLAMHPFLAKVTSDELLSELKQREAFGRAAEPWEVANVMVFLASDYASYMTGEVVAVESAARPGALGMTAEPSATRREELLAITARLFAKKGFRNTTVRDIADAAGILSGSLYHHFDSKESMVDEILSTFQEELFGQYDEILASDDDARTKLERAVLVSVRGDRQAPRRGRDLPERRGVPADVRAVRLPRRAQPAVPRGLADPAPGRHRRRRAPRRPRPRAHLPLHPRHRLGRGLVVPPRRPAHPHRDRAAVPHHPAGGDPPWLTPTSSTPSAPRSASAAVRSPTSTPPTSPRTRSRPSWTAPASTRPPSTT